MHCDMLKIQDGVGTGEKLNWFSIEDSVIHASRIIELF